jgi:hypothetical protein
MALGSPQTLPAADSRRSLPAPSLLHNPRVVVVLARAILALVFLGAGSLKLIDPATPQDLAAFGLNQRLARLVVAVLPWAEIAVAGALLFSETAIAGAAVALALLSAFAIVIAATLRRGDAPPCSCFGALHPTPISRRTLWRNGVLAALALVVITLGVDDPGPSLVGWVSNDWRWISAAIVLSALAAAGIWGLHGILRVPDAPSVLDAGLHGVPEDRREPGGTARREGPPAGASVPDDGLTDIDGNPVTLSSLLRDGPVFLLSFGAVCGSCVKVYPHVAGWANTYRGRVRVLVLFDDAPDGMPEFGSDVVVWRVPRDWLRNLKLNWTPAAVLISKGGRTLHPAAFGAPAIARLARNMSRVLLREP